MARIENLTANAGCEELSADALDRIAGGTTCDRVNQKVRFCGIEMIQGCGRIEVTWWDGRETWWS
jgi:hypothetical protein